MKKKAAIIDFLGTVVIPSESPRRLLPIPGAAEAIKRLSQEFDIYISSESPVIFIKDWAEKNDLLNVITAIYGSNNGIKTEHLKDILQKNKYAIILYIADGPEDLNVNCENMIKIAVNLHLDDGYENMRVYRGSLTVDLIEKYMEG